MAGVVAVAKAHRLRVRGRQARQDGNPVIALLAGLHDVRVAERLQYLQGKAVFGALGLLQAESGFACSRKRRTCSMRRRTELMFQVVTVSRNECPSVEWVRAQRRHARGVGMMPRDDTYNDF